MAFDKQRWRIFAAWLKTEREKANLSQDGLADLIDVDRQTIYRLENALSGTRRETVLKIADAINADKATALNKAGFAMQNAELPELPEFLYKINWKEFNENELFSVERFIGFIMYERHRGQVVGIPIPEAYELPEENLFSHLHRPPKKKKTG